MPAAPEHAFVAPQAAMLTRVYYVSGFCEPILLLTLLLSSFHTIKTHKFVRICRFVHSKKFSGGHNPNVYFSKSYIVLYEANRRLQQNTSVGPALDPGPEPKLHSPRAGPDRTATCCCACVLRCSVLIQNRTFRTEQRSSAALLSVLNQNRAAMTQRGRMGVHPCKLSEDSAASYIPLSHVHHMCGSIYLKI